MKSNANIKLRRKRRSFDITGEMMAKKLGFKSSATYYKKENGQSKFTIEEAGIIANALNTTIEDLFINEGEVNNGEKASPGA